MVYDCVPAFPRASPREQPPAPSFVVRGGSRPAVRSASVRVFGRSLNMVKIIFYSTSAPATLKLKADIHKIRRALPRAARGRTPRFVGGLAEDNSLA